MSGYSLRPAAARASPRMITTKAVIVSKSPPANAPETRRTISTFSRDIAYSRTPSASSALRGSV